MAIAWSLSFQEVRCVGENVDKRDSEQEEELMITNPSARGSVLTQQPGVQQPSVVFVLPEDETR